MKAASQALRRAGLGVMCLWAPAIAMAQAADASKVVPTPKDVPSTRELAPRLAPGTTDPAALPAPAVPRELGKPQDELSIDVSAYEVPPEAPAALRAALPALTAAYVGKAKSYEDLINAASEVTRFLQRDLGLYLGYAYIPEQEPRDGRVRIGVLEGRLDRVVLNWNDALPVRREVVEAYLARLQPGAVLRVRDVERVVFLVNDLRGITATFEIKAGSTPGTAMLVVTPKAEPRWTGKVDLDGNGSRFLGEARVSALVSGNSLAGRGDALTLTALASFTGGMRFALAGYTMPLGNDGFKLGSTVSLVQYKIDEAQFQNNSGKLGLEGNAVSVNLYGLYPWVRSRNLNAFALASLERKQYDDKQGASETKKHTDSLTLGLTGDFRDALLTGAVNTFEANVVAGRLAYEGAGLLSQTGDDASYTKVTMAYSRLQNVVSNRVLLYLSLRAQLASANLDTTEQFRLGGPDGVRAFAAGEGTGDSGILGTLELRLLPPDDWFGRVSREMVFGVFADGGSIKVRDRPTTAASRTSLAGAGLSVAWVRPNEYALRVSLASPVKGEAKADPTKRNPRLYAQFSKFF